VTKQDVSVISVTKWPALNDRGGKLLGREECNLKHVHVKIPIFVWRNRRYSIRDRISLRKFSRSIECGSASRVISTKAVAPFKSVSAPAIGVSITLMGSESNGYFWRERSYRTSSRHMSARTRSVQHLKDCESFKTIVMANI
jgi:hypothetical protein